MKLNTYLMVKSARSATPKKEPGHIYSPIAVEELEPIRKDMMESALPSLGLLGGSTLLGGTLGYGVGNHFANKWLPEDENDNWAKRIGRFGLRTLGALGGGALGGGLGLWGASKIMDSPYKSYQNVLNKHRIGYRKADGTELYK